MSEQEVAIRANEIEYVPIDQLIPYEKNMNQHTPEQIERLCQLIQYQGFRDPLIVQKGTNVIAAGHGRWEAAKKLGMETVPVTYQEFENEAQFYAFVVSHNAIAKDSWASLDLGKINTDILDLGPELEIEMLGLKDFEVEPLDRLDPQTDEDSVPEVEHPITRRGDIWLLGNHRVMCGDSTMIDDVEKLMNGETPRLLFTSPPYSDMRDYNGSKDLSVSNLVDFIPCYSNSEQMSINLGLQRKNNEIHDYWTPFIEKAKDSEYLFSSWNIWDKGEATSIANQTAMFSIEHEWIFVFTKKKESLNKTVDCKWSNSKSTANSRRNKDGSVTKVKDKIIGNKKQLGTVYKIGALKARNLDLSHPAMFSVDFAEGYIEAMTNTKDLVVEPFCGSGSTLIACEKTNRKCYGMELDEKYCDVIISRWEQYTGKTATLEATGQTYSELKVERDGEA